jgi:ABC-type Fe3+ transport system permease subunit
VPTTSLVVVLALAALVLVPLAREYAKIRDEGLGRLAALATTLLIVPSLAIGLSVSLSLSDHPSVQWMGTVTVTLAAYSLAASALRSLAASEAPRRSS